MPLVRPPQDNDSEFKAHVLDQWYNLRLSESSLGWCWRTGPRERQLRDHLYTPGYDHPLAGLRSACLIVCPRWLGGTANLSQHAAYWPLSAGCPVLNILGCCPLSWSVAWSACGHPGRLYGAQAAHPALLGPGAWPRCCPSSWCGLCCS